MMDTDLCLSSDIAGTLVLQCVIGFPLLCHQHKERYLQLFYLKGNVFGDYCGNS